MSNFVVRGITGFIYVLLIVSSILWNQYAFVVVFLIFMTFTVLEFNQLVKKTGKSPLILMSILTSIFIFISFYLQQFEGYSNKIFFGIIPFVLSIPVLEIFSNKNNSIENVSFSFMSIVYIAIPFSILILITNFQNSYEAGWLLFLFIVLWANDSGAYITGSFMGKTKLIERISPNKTWEGAIGGALFALVFALASSWYFELFELKHTIIISILIVISGTFGDLTESLLKRTFSVKDSGKFLPGHGGLLDRFDSTLFAAPLYFFYISIFVK